ncbi:MAG TPA: ribosome silencing factor [Saprospiraceae bacterium]|nr:ribosome silencing factor [Saprospiraceae bacterium]
MPRTKAIPAIPAKQTDPEFLALIIDSIQDIKGKNIVQLDLRHLPDAPASYFIICEGDSSTQIKAIAGNVERRAKAEAGVLAHSEGQLGARWVLVDFFDVVVHVFDKETRRYYELEDLWSDARFTEYKNI